MHHTNKENARFADLSDKELEKIREAEKALNASAADSNNQEIILLAYKQAQQHR